MKDDLLSDGWAGLVRKSFQVGAYDLGATLDSGQSFRWEPRQGGWEGVLGARWVRLVATYEGITAVTLEEVADWNWLEHYLQIRVNLAGVLAQFPQEEPMRLAVESCRGLRLLRQDPWECLASFILSSTKQIVQIKQVVQLLCERFGQPVVTPAGRPVAYSFPTAQRLAQVSEAELRACKMGFRAPYLKAASAAVAEGTLDLANLGTLPVDEAREQLLRLPGVGRKIADCVLLFAYGFQEAFPVDVWVSKALQELYFPRKKVIRRRLESFSRTHFGPYAGYAQQYLFHYMRTRRVRPPPTHAGGCKDLVRVRDCKLT